MNLVKIFGKMVKRFFVHIKSLGLVTSILILFISIPLVIWRIHSSDADNYLAEFLGVLVTIYFIDFLASERDRRQESKVKDIAIQYMGMYCDNIEVLLKRLLSKGNISKPNGRINILSMKINEIYEIIIKEGFWESDVEISVSDITYTIKRKELFDTIINYGNEGSNKIILHYNNQIDVEIRDLLHQIERQPEYYVLINNLETDYIPLLTAEYICSLITMINELRVINNKNHAQL